MKQISPNSMIQNRYLVVHIIGEGGMGEVYLAVDQRLGSAVALKRTHFSGDEALGNAFEREAKIMARLRHPVLPKVIDHFIENGDQFLVMEHISGDDLAKRLELAHKPFPLRWVMFWADQLLDALTYLHSHEPPIIHRDIKPHNLKLTDENHIVLLDFGLAKDFDTHLDSDSPVSVSVVGYSPHFAPMEQIRGTGTNARSDIYSFSATIYQLLTNTMPVDALSRADTMLGGGKDPIIPLTEINPEVTTAVSDVILKGIAIRQEDRFGTASEMQRELRRAFKQSPSPTESGTQAFLDDIKTEVLPNAATLISDSTEQGHAAQILTETDVQTGSQMTGWTEEIDTILGSRPKEQAGIKTEVIPAGDLNVVANDAEQVAAEGVPPSVWPVEDSASVAAGAAQVPLQTPAAIPPQKSKSSSKVGLVVGGLIGLLLFGVIAGGAGWYAYNNYYLPSKANVPPTPEPSKQVSPSPQPSVVALGGDSENTNSNSTAETIKDTNTTESNTNKTVVTAPAVRPTPQTVTKGPPVRTSQTPTAKATPKPKAKDDRTVILQ